MCLTLMELHICHLMFLNLASMEVFFFKCLKELKDLRPVDDQLNSFKQKRVFNMSAKRASSTIW